MKLMQAMNITTNLLARVARTLPNVRVEPDGMAAPDPDGRKTAVLSVDEQLALKVIWEFSKRMIAAKSTLRALYRAVGGEDDLNQMSLLDGGEGGGD